MICQKCREDITMGEAAIPERINGSNHVVFYHPGCHTRMKDERERAEERIENAARMARTVH